jgi:hypothetical protein
MKKTFLLIAALFACLSALTAQITQGLSDKIVLNRMSCETRLYTIYAKEDVQADGITITTSNGETLELDYPCWVYYANYTDETDGNVGHYLIINESNGSLLEVNARNDAGPEDFTEWRKVLPGIKVTPVLIEEGYISYNQYYITPKQNRVVTNETEWKNLKALIENDLTDIEIDFDAYQVIAAIGGSRLCDNWTITTEITEFPDSIVVTLQEEKGDPAIWWSEPKESYYHIVKIPVSDKKIVFQHDLIEIPSTGTSCRGPANLSDDDACKVIIINSKEELENYGKCNYDYSAIDFSKQTLLLVYIGAPGGGSTVSALFKDTANKYTLNVTVYQTTAATFTIWRIFTLVPKIPDGTNIMLDARSGVKY